MTDYKYCIVLKKSELFEVLDALYLATTEWGEPSCSLVGAVAPKIRSQIADEDADAKCVTIVKNTLQEKRGE